MATVEENRTTREALDAYLNRIYKGKAWRRLTPEEIAALDKEIKAEQQAELDRIEAEWKAANADMVAAEPAEWAPNEVHRDEQFIAGGPGGDLPADMTDAQIQGVIAEERGRIFDHINTPPRSEKYLKIFKAKYPDRTEEEIRNGFVLVDGDEISDEWQASIEKQEQTFVQQNRLNEEEIAARVELYGEEDTTPLALAPDMWAENEIRDDEYFQPDQDIPEHMSTEELDALVANASNQLKNRDLERGLPVVKKDESP